MKRLKNFAVRRLEASVKNSPVNYFSELSACRVAGGQVSSRKLSGQRNEWSFSSDSYRNQEKKEGPAGEAKDS